MTGCCTLGILFIQLALLGPYSCCLEMVRVPGVVSNYSCRIYGQEDPYSPLVDELVPHYLLATHAPGSIRGSLIFSMKRGN